ncbi:GGDEF domain-containing protein [Thiohalophilus sp.]|uniref:GGDEF domain-containing protein n=1 Tax=Thiohalophilus sp. TaxID=3028392 RepID=UPI002ACEABAB|nr:GGDEF domain-containing protein [Thiohalophilus sp.]MDZ7805280.1 GGDEF domain-containing protein [Thiohalophilus sp.]
MNWSVSTAELAELSLLKGISQADLSWLIHQCEVISLEEEQVLLTPEKDNHTIYIVLSGQLVVQFDSQRGGLQAHVDPGGWLGEMSVIDHKRPSATVVTETPVRLLAVHETIWWELIERSHVAARNFLHALSSRLREDNRLITEGMQKQKIFSEKAQTDSLTGLRNRHWLNEKLPELLRQQEAGYPSCSLLMLDIDHFKQFNDQYGHLAGDRVLQSVANIVRDNLRDNDAAIRYGGEEVILVLPDTNEHNAVAIAQRLRQFIREHKVKNYDGSLLPPVSVSIGVYMINSGDTAEQVLGRVDTALYEAKRTGRDRVVSWINE